MRDLVFNCQGGILFEQHYNSFVIYWVTYFQLIFGLFTLLILYMPDHRAIGWKSLSLHSHFHIHYVHLLGQLSVCYTSQPKTSKEQKVKVEESNSAPKQKCPTILALCLAQAEKQSLQYQLCFSQLLIDKNCHFRGK